MLHLATPSLTKTNRIFHKMLPDRVDVEYPRPDGSIKGDKLRLLDFAEPAANDWLVVNQLRVIEARHKRRPDLVVFVNGLPSALIELKNAAVEETVRASGMKAPGAVRDDLGRYWAGRMHGGKPGDRRAGVVWHTQGSGKSLTMLFFAARVIREAAMQNPTLVVLTDRNDLDDQLFGQFQRCADILGQTPVQAPSRESLRELLAVASGGVVFTTIQKFLPERGASMPELSPRRNIVVIADEAHRSQYDLIDGLARHMRDALPNASFIGFTGTPIEKTDANTRAVFGDYISIYDIQRAVADKATAIRDDVSFFQAIQAALNKQQSPHGRKSPEQIDAAVRQLVSKAITTEGQVIDVFTAAGLPKPDIGILSDEFLAEVRGLKHKNFAAELLEKLLKDELKVRSKKNLVQSRLFSEKLKKTLNAYHNRAISTMQVLEEWM
jgi:type I site-specific restriction-modification system R (restriction) subunit